MTTTTTERERLLTWAASMADPNWCLSVPKEAKDVIGKLVDMIQATPEVPQIVLDHINQRSEYVTACRNTRGSDNEGDYWRWQGHAESRRQLAEKLGYTVPYEATDKTEPKVTKK